MQAILLALSGPPHPPLGKSEPATGNDHGSAQTREVTAVEVALADNPSRNSILFREVQVANTNEP